MVLSLLENVYQFMINLPLTTEVTLYALIVLLTLCYWYLQVPKGIPPGPLGLPIIGYIPFIGEKPHKTFSKLSQRYGPVFRIYMGNKLTIILNDYESVKETFVQQADVFSGRPKNLMFSALPHEEYNIVVTDGPKWKEHRRFALSILRDCGLGKVSYEQLIMGEIQQCLAEIKKFNGEPTDLSNILGLSVFNNICILLLGKTFSYEDSWMINAKHTIDKTASQASFMLILQIWPWLRYVPGIFKLTKQDSLMSALCDLDNSIKSMSDELKNQKEGDQRDNYMAAYIKEQRDRDKRQQKHFFEDTGLQQNVRTMLAAGTETTSSTLSWFIKYLMVYPEVQTKIQKEIDQVIGSERAPSWSDRNRTPYTEATICEVMRIAPLIPIIVPHRNQEECTIKGYKIPKGCDILVNSWDIHHDPKLWKDPEQFRPERFLSQNGEAVKPEYFMPFSLGKRQCLGESLARVELYLYATSMLQRFTFKEAEGTISSLEERPGFTYAPNNCRSRAILRSVQQVAHSG